ncbi:tetratricopeptide repeat protein [Lentzea sp. NBRC 102530]|uniref:tetratricopeptide repeat protein n=1 Tax=Lentzea sp. NBRC 102530 TaxID=3032201 RepID=UPI002554115E|nr:tetratricopeptide repeat protein [Lentzea sp. NBRC 102530]
MSGNIDGQLIVGGVHFYPRPQVSWPVQSGLVPSLAAHHQKRDMGLLDAPTVVLVPDESEESGLVMSGMGGVGKTQIAAHVAHSSRASVDLLVWVTASSQDAVVAAYSDAARKILVAEDNWDPDRGAQAFLEWFATTKRPWLVVLDDVPTPQLLSRLWPPNGSAGRTIVTTRYRGYGMTGRGRRVVEVGVFTPAMSRAFLLAELADSPIPSTEVDLDDLAADLGHLPLALAHAASYVMSRQQSVPAYRTLLADRRRKVEAVFPKEYELGEGHTRTIAATWQVSVSLADELLSGVAPVGTAAALMRVAALLDPNGVPTDLFNSPAVLQSVSTAVGEEVDGHHLEEALHVLDQLSLLTVDRPGGQTRVHGLVQRVIRESLISDGELAVLARSAGDGLLQIWAQADLSGGADSLFQSNTIQLLQHAGSHLHHPEVHRVLFVLGHSFRAVGQLSRAQAHFLDLHTTIDRLRGGDHRDSLVCRGELARLEGESGRPDTALTSLEDLRADCHRVLGADDHESLSVRAQLAHWRGVAGHPAAALQEFEEVLIDDLRVLGPDHRDTLSTRGNIARSKGDCGDHGGAIAGYEALLPDLYRVLGPDHVVTLSVRANLANQRGEAGNPAVAVTELEGLLSDLKRVRGSDHPDTLIVRGNLASWKGSSGDPAGALGEFRALVEDRARVLGDDHPSVLMARNNFVHWMSATEGPVRAVREYRALFADQTRVLGPHHPATLATRGNLAGQVADAGDPITAVAELTQVLAECRQALGAAHPHTFGVWAKLVTCRELAGDISGAIEEGKRLLAEMLIDLPRDHPEVLILRGNLAGLQADPEDPARTISEYVELLADSRRVLGQGHSSIFAIRVNLATLRANAGELDEAVAEFQLMLREIVSVRGADHPEARFVRSLLNEVRMLQR